MTKLKFLKHRGFSLIELLVVIAIIAMLVTAGTVSWRNAQIKSRDAKRKTDLKTVQEALERYYTYYGEYPRSTTAGEMICDNAPTNTIIYWQTGGALRCLPGPSFLFRIPLDPIGEDQYYYFSDETTDGNRSYKLGANLENVNDPDRLDCSTANCDIGGDTRNYIVTNP